MEFENKEFWQSRLPRERRKCGNCNAAFRGSTGRRLSGRASMGDVKVVELEVPPPGVATVAGLVTATLALPMAATSAAEIRATSLEPEMNDVPRGLPFQLTTALGAKSDPLIVIWKSTLPEAMVDGVSQPILGVWLDGPMTGKSTTGEELIPFSWLTITLSMPGLAMSAAVKFHSHLIGGDKGSGMLDAIEIPRHPQRSSSSPLCRLW